MEAFAGMDTLKVPYESRGKGGFKRAVLKFVATCEDGEDSCDVL